MVDVVASVSRFITFIILAIPIKTLYTRSRKNFIKLFLTNNFSITTITKLNEVLGRWGDKPLCPR
jgi:hypothetical protein